MGDAGWHWIYYWVDWFFYRFQFRKSNNDQRILQWKYSSSSGSFLFCMCRIFYSNFIGMVVYVYCLYVWITTVPLLVDVIIDVCSRYNVFETFYFIIYNIIESMFVLLLLINKLAINM